MSTILVIDDDKDIIEIVKYVAGQDGHHVFQAANGLEGLSRVTADHPDLIVLDIMMPEMDGYTLSQELMLHPETKKIPVIILTAKSKMRESFLSATNVRGYMEKPFEPDNLLELIRTVLAETHPRPASD